MPERHHQLGVGPVVTRLAAPGDQRLGHRLLLVQGVGARFQHQYDRRWAAGDARRGRLVVIGEKGLDKAGIEALILA